MSDLWTSAQAALATGGKATSDWVANGVSIDTRTIQKGDLFVALSAARDGHEFVAQALEKGAAAALVSRIPDGMDETAPLLIVSDVLAGLEDLGRAARARTDARIVAVTGSVGKTSTKEMLRAMLGDQGRTQASVASYNNHWGVPLTLARMPADTEYEVIEIGMNHPGEIAPLSKMTRPHVTLITTVAAAHLEAFDNVEGIALEKASVMEGLEYGGVSVMNNDIETAAILQAKAHDLKRRDVGFGEHGFDYILRDVQIIGDTTIVQAEANEQPLLFKIATAGRHFAMNGLGALAACEALGADLALAAGSLGRWSPFEGRGAREVIILDPVETHLLAVAAVTNNTGRVAKGRRIAYLGDMKELGPQAEALHAEMASHVATAQLDTIHCVGPLMKTMYDALPEAQRGRWTATSAEMVQGIRRDLDAGDVVLAKGSLSMKLGLVVDAIRKMGHSTGPTA